MEIGDEFKISSNSGGVYSNNGFITISGGGAQISTSNNSLIVKDDSFRALTNNHSQPFIATKDAELMTKKATENITSGILNDAKSYTDSEIAKIPKTEYIKPYYNGGNKYLTLKKIHITNGLYAYEANTTININIPSDFKNKHTSTFLSVYEMRNTNISNSATRINAIFHTLNSSSASVSAISIKYMFFSSADLLPGTSGNFDGEITFKYLFVEDR